MAGSKAALLLSLLFLAGSAAAVGFNVRVDSAANATVIDPAWENRSSVVHEFNVTVENKASVGCSYRLRATMEREDGETEAAFSRRMEMWPGDARNMELNYYPGNFTGAVNSSVELLFCGRTQHVADYSFTFNSSSYSNETVVTETLRVQDTRAEVETSVANATLVPEEVPPYWRAGAARAEFGRAELEYEAPIFDRRKNLTYAVVENGEMVGLAEFSLTEPEPTRLERIMQRSDQILGVLLIASLLVNLYLARRRILPEKVLEAIEELEFGDRDVRRG